MFRPKKDDKEPVRPTGGLGGLGHVSRKNPTPRPAPRELIKGTSAQSEEERQFINSPYSAVNNSEPNFQTPTMDRPQAQNFSPQIAQNNPSPLGTSHAPSSKKKLFTPKNIAIVSALAGISYMGFAYTRNRSVDEFEADMTEDDE